MDARSVTPMWTHDVSTTLWVQRTGRLAQDAAPFEPWCLPGSKQLLLEGQQLSLIARWGAHSARWMLSDELHDGDACAYLLPAGRELDVRLRELQRHRSELNHLPNQGQTSHQRPSRAALVHMRTLQALDAALAGATHRDIACAVFAAADVQDRWHPDSELRAQVRHLVRRGRQLMLGGYRHLLGGTETATGRLR